MKVYFSKLAKEDYQYWEKTNSEMLTRIDKLISDIKRHPFAGIGKPEPLRYEKSGYWSRRINHEHRLVYKIEGETMYIAQCRYHY